MTEENKKTMEEIKVLHEELMKKLEIIVAKIDGYSKDVLEDNDKKQIKKILDNIDYNL